MYVRIFCVSCFRNAINSANDTVFIQGFPLVFGHWLILVSTADIIVLLKIRHKNNNNA